MSDALTDEAPVEEVAAPPVGDPAPAPEAAAEEGSADGGKTVSAERFNGLMAAMNREKSRADALEAQLAEHLQSMETPKETEPVADEALAERLADTQAALAEVLLDRARDKALEKYPNARPFADLLNGSNQAEIEEVARLVSERAEVLTAPAEDPAAEEGDPPAEAAAEGATEPVTPAAEAPAEPPVVGGAAPASGENSLVDRKNEALKAGDFLGFANAVREIQDGASTEVS